MAEYNPRVSLKPEDPEWKDIEASINEFGQVVNLVVNTRTGNLVSGHQRVTIMRHMGHKTAKFVEVDVDEAQERRMNIALNKIGGRWDQTKLEQMLAGMQAQQIDISTLGFSPAELDDILGNITGTQPGNGTLAERFLIPPFTVLNAREGWWQARKSAWISLGIKSELGRGAGSIAPGGAKMPTVNPKTGKIARSDSRNRVIQGTDAGGGERNAAIKSQAAMRKIQTGK